MSEGCTWLFSFSPLFGIVSLREITIVFFFSFFFFFSFVSWIVEILLFTIYPWTNTSYEAKIGVVADKVVRAQSNREISSNIAQLLSAGKQQPLCSRFSLPLSHWINKTWLFLPDWHPHPPVHHPPLKRFSKTFYSPPVLRQCINILLYISTGSSAVSFSRGRLVDNLQLGCFITVGPLLAGNTELNHPPPRGNGLPIPNFSYSLPSSSI